MLPKWWAGKQGASQMVGRQAGCFPNGGQASRVLPKWWAGSPKNLGRVSSILKNEGRVSQKLGKEEHMFMYD